MLRSASFEEGRDILIRATIPQISRRMFRWSAVVAFAAGWGPWLKPVEAQYMRRPEREQAASPTAPIPRAATPTAAPAPAPPATATAEPGRLEIDADRLEYDADRRIMIGIGNVRVQHGQETLLADYIEVHSETQDALARGNVFFEGSGRTWRGEQFTYNFRTRQGDFGDFLAFADPYYIRAGESQHIAPNVISLQRPSITTCAEDERQEFVLRARSATVTDQSVLRARHVVAHLYGIPIFYTPYLKKDFDQRGNWSFEPGYSSRMGAYLLSAYHFYPTPRVRSSTQLDYRSKRGVGVGQRLQWRERELGLRGRLHGYYINDDLPIRSERQRPIREGLVDEDRYWIGLRHGQRIGERQYVNAELNYVSDPFMLEDFFSGEFRRRVQPENRLTLTHRESNFTAALQLNMRLNDFYENVNRLPEASLDVNRVEIGTTGFFYESAHRASYLERVFPKQQEDRDDYDSVRVDTAHTVLYPMRHFGFLAVTPSLGYRATWYSITPERFTTIDLVPLTGDDGELIRDEEDEEVVLFEEVERSGIRDGDSDLRHLLTFGLETSFKAFKVLNERPNYLGQGLRHVAEPYARYTYVPEPNLRPGDLYQFDAIDRLDQRNDIRLGVHNKLQTRRDAGRIRHLEDERDELGRLLEPEATPEDHTLPRARVHDFIDIETYTILRLDPGPDENDFDDFFFNARLRLTDWMQIDFDGAYDWDENEVRVFNTRWGFFAADRSHAGIEYRYRRDGRQTVQTLLDLFPQGRWSYTALWRYDIEEGDLEEQIYLVQRRFDCTRLGIGVRGRLTDGDDTEWRVWAQVSLLAFPEHEYRLGR